MKPDVQETLARLADYFPADALKAKPGVVTGDRALVLHYLDARAIMDRLDAVLGMTGWQDDYTPLPNGAVLCKLSLRLGGEWISKMDVGGESGQPDEGDRTKAAVSDALKRAAVKFGIGRYLYRLPTQWEAFDKQKKRFVNVPRVPPDFLPKGETHKQKLLAELRAACKEGSLDRIESVSQELAHLGRYKLGPQALAEVRDAVDKAREYLEFRGERAAIAQHGGG